MKSLIAVLFFVFIGQAQAAERTCYGKNESFMAKRDLICATVDKLDDASYRLSGLVHVTGGLWWGVSKYKSKNRICKNILAKFGEKRKVKFSTDSNVRGKYETFWGVESNGQIDCEIKE